MLHARHGVALRRRLLPVVLVGVCSVAFGGLAVLSPTGEIEPDVVAYSDAQPVPLLTPEQVELERGVARASRSRRIAEAEAAAQAAAAAAAAQAEAERVAAEKAAAEKAAAEKAAAEKAAAEKAAAEKAAAEKAKAAAAPSSGGGACPVPNASFTDTWGAARSGGRAHKGTDLLAPLGSPVYAVVSGRIKTASSSRGGISLYLQGDNGETYFYAHNSANVAANGQRVAAGALIARVGSTGNAGGTNHVHFERQVGGRAVNPYRFLRQLC